MSVGIGSTIKKTSTPFIGSTGTAKTAAPATADAAAAQAVPPGVQNADDDFKKLVQNPFSMWATPLTPGQVPPKTPLPISSGIPGQAGPLTPGQAPPKTPLPISSPTRKSPAQLKQEAKADQKLRSGSLAIGDFKGLPPEMAAKLVSKMASGGVLQRKNLDNLMNDPDFAKHLGTALGKMDPESKKAVEGYLGAKIGPREDLKTKLESGSLEASDFKGLSRGKAGDHVAAMAKGSDDQRANLQKLMADPAFATHLKTALNKLDLPPADRIQILRTAGEIEDPSAKAMAMGTLWKALDEMQPSRRDDVLREGLAGRDNAVLVAVNNYLTSKPEAAAQLLKSTTSQGIDDDKLTSILKGVDPKSLAGALKALGSGSAEDAQNVFKRLGAAVYTSKQGEGIRAQVEKGLNEMPPASRAALLQKVIADPSGTEPNDQQVNLGHQLVAQYFERMKPKPQGVKDFLDSIAPANPWANAPPPNPNDPKQMQAFLDYTKKVSQDPAQHMRNRFESFIQKNGTSVATQRAADRPGRLEPKNVAKADSALAELNKAPDFKHVGNFAGSGWQAPHDNYVEAVKGLSPAELEAHFGKLSTDQASKLVNVLSPDRSLGYDYADKTRLELVNDVASRGGPVARAKIAAGMAKTFEKAPPNDSNKELVRAQVAQLLKTDPNGAIREMSNYDLQNVAKVFMAHPANMEKLNELLPDLGPQAAARLMHAVAVIAPEVAGEAKNGTWEGDFIKGLSFEGEGAPGKISWSPSAMVDGDRQRSADQVNSQFSRFMDGWTQQLNEMSPNEKAIFAAKFANKVTPEVR